MIKLPTGLDFQQFPRVAAYAVIAALLTAALFAADGAYHWYRVPGTQVTDVRSVEPPAPTSVKAQAAAPALPAASQVTAETPQPETRKIEERAETGPAASQPSNSTSGSNSNQVSGSIASSAAGSIERPAAGLVAGPSPRVTVGSDDAAPQQPRPTLSQQPSRQQARRPSAKQAARERATPRRPVQAATKPPARTVKPAEKPNVYWERDSGSQLGFAPQLRKRTCNPATGQMPMQCYYPREGRDKFPAKPLN
jgi:hypothetical protein